MPARTMMFRLSRIVVWLWLFFPVVAFAQQGWEKFSPARIVESDSNDGDSFVVEFERDGKIDRHVLRLYFVDAPETSVGSDADRRRVLEQMRYFGVENPTQVLELGKQAEEFALGLMAEPFIVHTAFANAMGRSASPRYYSMIELADGTDLAARLVAEGHARPRGVGRALPDETPSAEYAAYLADLESSAMLARKGSWALADAAKIAEMRAAERREARELREVFGESSEPVAVNPNTASMEELQRVPGIGEMLADRIIMQRPFDGPEHLTRHGGAVARISSLGVKRGGRLAHPAYPPMAVIGRLGS